MMSTVRMSPVYKHREVIPSSSCSSTSSNSNSAIRRLEQFRTQHELARNFYDDFEFCPVQCPDELYEHRERIQQRISPQSSPRASPPLAAGYISPRKNNASKRAIPIINPTNMAQVSVPARQPSPLSHWSAQSSVQTSHTRMQPSVVYGMHPSSAYEQQQQHHHQQQQHQQQHQQQLQQLQAMSRFHYHHQATNTFTPNFYDVLVQ
ncbi:hypothetical protein BDF14DRAFT_1828028 [Spinellus fusiger]|nr:hypothetical protein BDF14DRAFT_1828028 [Spinellus fusiger]